MENLETEVCSHGGVAATVMEVGSRNVVAFSESLDLPSNSAHHVGVGCVGFKEHACVTSKKTKVPLHDSNGVVGKFVSSQTNNHSFNLEKNSSMDSLAHLNPVHKHLFGPHKGEPKVRKSELKQKLIRDNKKVSNVNLVFGS